MPVPSSYNDITTDWRIRDHVGLVWYDRTFFVPKFWPDVTRVWLRFGSVSYAAQVVSSCDLSTNDIFVFIHTIKNKMRHTTRLEKSFIARRICVTYKLSNTLSTMCLITID